MPSCIRARTLLLFAAGVIGLPTCSDPSAPAAVTVTAVAVTASNNQTGFAGAELPKPLRVRVEFEGAPKAGLRVTWEASQGSIAPRAGFNQAGSSTTTLTGADGVAAAFWHLGDVPGPMSVSATVEGVRAPVHFTATALSALVASADPATDGQTGEVGAALSRRLRVTVQSGGAPQPGAKVTWQTSSGSVIATSGRTNAAGIAAATWTLGSIPGTVTAYATVEGAGAVSPVEFTATGVPLGTVIADPASNYQIGVIGTALSQPLRITVQKLDGAPKAGVEVTWVASGGSIAPASSVTDVHGSAAAIWTLGPVAEVGTEAYAYVEGADGSPATFYATALHPLVTATADRGTDHQSGVVGTTLPLALRVFVHDLDGSPKAGITVNWTAQGGSVAPTSNLTDAAGVATTTWRLGLEAGALRVSASVDGAQGVVDFNATALPGPVVAIEKVSGDSRPLPSNQRTSLIAKVVDQYGNRIEGQAITWTVVSGPVAFATIGGATDEFGQSASIVTASAAQGAAVVRAALTGGGASVDFALTIGPRAWDVILDPRHPPAFISSQNGSSPAQDFIPAGQTMRWTLSPFDYDNHYLVSVGTPSFQGGGFPYGGSSSVSVTFTTPGTYQYTDFYNPGATGIVVVQ